jgi:hypothetical protein
MSRLLSARQTTTDKVLVRLQPSDLNQLVSVKPGAVQEASSPHSTVTLFARFRGLSTSVPRAQAVW